MFICNKVGAVFLLYACKNGSVNSTLFKVVLQNLVVDISPGFQIDKVSEPCRGELKQIIVMFSLVESRFMVVK